jgi:hypothetical protein
MGTWDPLPHLAALIDGLRQLAAQPAGDPDFGLLASLLTGPYAALRGGLLLDEPGREDVTAEDALREALEARPRVLRDVELRSWGPVLDPPWPEPVLPGRRWDETMTAPDSEEDPS